MSETLNQKLDRIERELAEIKAKPVIKQINYSNDISKINDALLIISKRITSINYNDDIARIDKVILAASKRITAINYNEDIEKINDAVLSNSKRITAITSGISSGGSIEDIKKLVTIDFINNLYRNK